MQVSDQVGGTIVTLLEAQGTPDDLARVDHPKIALEETIGFPDAHTLLEARGTPMATIIESRLDSLEKLNTHINTTVTGLGSSETCG